MRQILLPFFLIAGLVGPVSSGIAANIGVATDVEGDVQLLRDNAYHEVVHGVEFQQSDSVVTGENSKLQIDMVDGTNFLIGSNARMRFEKYVLHEDKSVISSAVHLVSGWLRFAVAKLNEGRRYTIETPTITMGIRGTEGVVEARENRGALFLDEGEVHLYEADGTNPNTAPMAVSGGQHAEHHDGRGFQKGKTDDAQRAQAMPGRMKARLKRRAHLLKKRGIKPRMMRAARHSEMKKFLLKNPKARQKIRQRMTDSKKKRKTIRKKRIKKFKKKFRRRQNS